jgi:hypothetical protein
MGREGEIRHTTLREGKRPAGIQIASGTDTTHLRAVTPAASIRFVSIVRGAMEKCEAFQGLTKLR